MASVYESARSASKSRQGRSGSILLSAALACGVLAGSAWAVVSTLHAMQDAASSLAEGRRSIAASLSVASAVIGDAQPERLVKVAKFSRLSPPSESEIRQKQLTAEAIQASRQRKISIELASAVKREKAKALMIETAVARAERSVEQEKAITGERALVTAMLPDDVSGRKSIQPFGLVMKKAEAEEEDSEDDILSDIPLPETRPALETVTIERKPAEEKPATRTATRQAKEDDDDKDVAIVKPERSLFGDLFKSRGNSTGWVGKGTKVAIYDVSNATVYMPDGTKLEAHSGLGSRLDDPRFVHERMRGATPPHVYDLTMREKLFHGVPAIRLNPVGGNSQIYGRTGLLAHTYMLGPKGDSNGCVSFRDYNAFLKAFRNGEVKRLAVVASLKS